MNLVNDTPLIHVDGIYAKLECVHPTGSIKDRIAKYIVDESEARGLLKPGMKIVEATSGNTGIALSYYGREKGYDVTIVMPEDMTEERKALVRSFGATLILASKEGSFQEAVSIRDRMAKESGFFNPDQFSNPLNVECHYRTTGKEILSQIKEHGVSVDAFVAGVGTGGTLIGVGQALKEMFPNLRVVAMEPDESAVMGGGKGGAHGIPGIGDGFIPAIVQGSKNGLHPLIDEVIRITSADAKKAAEYLAREHGLCLGMSSGANYLAAKALAKKFKTVVTVFADGYSKYQSMGLKRFPDHHCVHAKDCPCRSEDAVANLY